MHGHHTCALSMRTYKGHRCCKAKAVLDQHRSNFHGSRWYAPCCKIAFDPKGIMMCGHEWNVEPEFPYGDALRGGPWKYTYPDPGKYDGDELWGDKKSTGSSSSAVRLR